MYSSHRNAKESKNSKIWKTYEEWFLKNDMLPTHFRDFSPKNDLINIPLPLNHSMYILGVGRTEKSLKQVRIKFNLLSP